MEIPALNLIIFWAVIAFVISKAMIPSLLLLAEKKHLYDDGDDFRKLHNGLIPTLGGVAIFTAFMISFSASSFADEIQGYGYFVAACLILFAAGLKDDLIDISPKKKLAAQFLATGLIVFGCDMQFTNMGGVFGADAISPWIGIPLTFYTVIVVINAYNLIDGIDALGGSIGVFVSGFFGYWFYTAGIYPMAMLSFVLAGSILGFLWYNRPPAKIFMGDTGSLMIGFFMSVLAINFVEYSITAPNVVFWQPAAPIIVAAVMVVPLYDTLRIFIIRALKGKSPFEADKGHIHHHLIKAGFSHGQIVVFLLSLSVIILGTIIISSLYLSNTWLLALLLGISVLIFPTNNFKRKLLAPFVSEEWKVPPLEEEEAEVISAVNAEEFDLDSEEIQPEKELEKVRKTQILQEAEV